MAASGGGSNSGGGSTGGSGGSSSSGGSGSGEPLTRACAASELVAGGDGRSEHLRVRRRDEARLPAGEIGR